MAAPGSEARPAPELITLGVRAGSRPSPRPPVRIFVGSEPAQLRAERVLVWSIERVRDPSRVYEIHLLKGLIGFRRRDWTTGFSNYRFAVPFYAGARGRALYNEVGQVYLTDPAELFDAELGPHGYLAVAPEDPSVMLLDCARMAGIWPLAAAQRRSKRSLLRRALSVPGLWGRLAPEWNARDGEYRPGQSKCAHFTTLHTQPWCPFPERFVYQRHPHAELWFEVERSADREGFQVFSRERPSRPYRELGASPLLEQTPPEDLPWVLDERFRNAREKLELSIWCDPPAGAARGPDGLHEPIRSAAWWTGHLDAATQRHPGVRWEAELRTPGRPVRHRSGGPRENGSPPRVWVLTDDRPGNTTQSLGLGEALGWPFERKKLQPGPLSALHNRLLGATRRSVALSLSDRLEPPWPDLVIAAGRRTAPVALWVREQTAGRTRLVHLGRKGGDYAALFDLVATPSYSRLFPHPRRWELHGPLHRITAQRLLDAAERWRELERHPSPRIALLVGGTSGQYRLGRDTAHRLGRDVAHWARELSGSVLASTSRRTSTAATAALRRGLGDVPGCFHRAGDPGENPYLGFLAWADALVVTADSESMLAEATSLGRPVYVYPLPSRATFRLLRGLREPLVRRALAQPPGLRGVARPQRGLERLSARLIERGFVRPTRDLDLLHVELVGRGAARFFGDPGPPPSARPLSERELLAERIRAMMGVPK
jgi:mitochondrial fission protein ELM1